MRTYYFLTAVACVLFAAATAVADEQWTFEDAKVGKLPEGWSSAKTGKGPGSVWKVLEDKSALAGAKVLAQTSSEAPSRLYNLCVADETKYTDVEITLRIKPLKGEIDQAGGPVWRYQDANNYYIARMNPLEENYRFYKVVAGKRRQLATMEGLAVPAGQWYTLRIVHKGDHIQCYLNSKLHLDVKNDAIKTVGKVGLWTKADAVTSFDDFKVSQPK